ncbi:MULTISPECIES: hypothetical protein [Actinomadura]|uniref:Uncharacterized protein n=1 Tax=Actinomadura litoris TaxID=2678616 RepID=A0A7K1L9I8_9ACTN|nr:MULTISPECIES: hypothetical protein [Actinomadura]MBT2212886.1 hypothetical protein [Actinomadura sp. NEAU-AAG7]MUN40906.1 hypothetical protein [Actinomadura litoris]
MSSAVLYLAIVAVWAVVLVPMWLRRDTEAGITRLLHKRAEEPTADTTPPDTLEEAPEPPQPEHGARPARPGRAAVIARRRRRTAGLSLLAMTTIVLTATGVAPWWAVLPPVALLAGHLALLRVAVGMDAARAQAAAEARAKARQAEQPTEPAETAEPAEVIELVPADEVFDQYADDRRAVGE